MLGVCCSQFFVHTHLQQEQVSRYPFLVAVVAVVAVALPVAAAGDLH
jgi:hypothetical protein